MTLFILSIIFVSVKNLIYIKLINKYFKNLKKINSKDLFRLFKFFNLIQYKYHIPKISYNFSIK
jgi:hypothetical protein